MDCVGFNFNIWLKMPRINTLTSVSPNLVISGDGEFYSFSANTTSVNEGNTALFTVSTRNVSETTLYWSILPVSGTVNAFDVDSLTGSFSLTSNTGSFSVSLVEDSSTEGQEIFQVQLRKTSTSGPIIANSSFIIANDTSLAPSYTLTANTTSVNEGNTVSFIVDTQNVPNDTVLYWTTLQVSGTINSSDFSDGLLEGNVTINNNTASFIRTLSNDLTTEGTESFLIQLRRNSNTGTIVANSANITITDTSTTSGQVLLEFNSPSPITTGTSVYNRNVTLSWTVPDGVTSISVVCIGGGGGGSGSGTFTNPSSGAGGGLSYRNNFTVTPGETLNYTVGGGGAGSTVRGSAATLWRGSVFSSGSVLICGAYGGTGPSSEGSDGIPNATGGSGGARLTHNSSLPAQPNAVGGSNAVAGSDGGGQGGNGGTATSTSRAAGGGGAAGYAGNGGAGGTSGNGSNAPSGGGGGGGGSGTVGGGGGGGTLPTGQTSSGSGGGTVSGEGERGGGGTVFYNFAQRASGYGGGGGGKVGSYTNSSQNGTGERACVRIIWPGDTRQFPSTNTADV